MKVEIIAVETGWINSEIINANIEYMEKLLFLLDMKVTYSTTVDNNPESIKNAFLRASDRSNIIITTSSLNADDHTFDAVCKATDALLVSKSRLSQEGLNKNGKAFALPSKVPENATFFYGEQSYACIFEYNGALVVVLPINKKELFDLFSGKVLNYLKQFTDREILIQKIGLYGISLSAVKEKVRDLNNKNTAVFPVKNGGEIDVIISVASESGIEAKERLQALALQVTDSFSGYCYGVNQDSLERYVVELLKKKKLKIATAESCTAGLLSKRITDIPGASEVFEFGVSAYSSKIKEEILKIDPQILRKYGEVSAETACVMAEHARIIGNADIGVGITGIAGPQGGTPQKPVGLVFISISDGERIWVTKLLDKGDSREDCRNLSASHALDMVRRYCEALPGVMEGGNLISAANFEIRSSKLPDTIEPRTKREKKIKEKKQSRILAFLKGNFIPSKGDSMPEIIRKIILITAILLFIGAGWMLLYENVVLPNVNKGIYDEWEKIYQDIQDAGGQPGALPANVPNPDYMGWITIKGTRVNYPVMHAKRDNPDFYLKHDANRKRNGYGAIYLDSANTINDQNLILHGHNMARYRKDTQMFATLLYYKDIKAYKKNPIINFNTIYGNTNWKIFAAMIVNTKESEGPPFYYLYTNFSSDKQFMRFVEEVKVRSLINTPVDVQPGDQLLTLSTCTYEVPDARFVVLARKVRPGESLEVDMSKAHQNPEPLYPDAYYTKNKITKPAWIVEYLKNLENKYSSSSETPSHSTNPSGSSQASSQPSTSLPQPGSGPSGGSSSGGGSSGGSSSGGSSYDSSSSDSESSDGSSSDSGSSDSESSDGSSSDSGSSDSESSNGSSSDSESSDGGSSDDSSSDSESSLDTSSEDVSSSASQGSDSQDPSPDIESDTE